MQRNHTTIHSENLRQRASKVPTYFMRVEKVVCLVYFTGVRYHRNLCSVKIEQLTHVQLTSYQYTTTASTILEEFV